MCGVCALLHGPTGALWSSSAGSSASFWGAPPWWLTAGTTTALRREHCGHTAQFIAVEDHQQQQVRAGCLVLGGRRFVRTDEGAMVHYGRDDACFLQLETATRGRRV